jgi:hypothetical protein
MIDEICQESRGMACSGLLKYWRKTYTLRSLLNIPGRKMRNKWVKGLFMDNEQQEMVTVIGDFLEQGHTDTIVSLLRSDPGLFGVSGELVADERFMVRLGMAIVFEELAAENPEAVALAVPSLRPLLKDESPLFRGEAATILGMIGSEEALGLLEELRNDPQPQVAELVNDILAEATGN